MTEAPSRGTRTAGRDQRKASISNIDHNARPQAAVAESAADAAANAAFQPAEQAGRG